MRIETESAVEPHVQNRAPSVAGSNDLARACWPRPTAEEVAALAAVLLAPPDASAEPSGGQVSPSRWAMAGRQEAHHRVTRRLADGSDWRRRDRYG